MARPLPQREVEIGQRLRAFREGLLIQRTAFAARAGIGEERLRANERGVAPVRFDVFAQLYRRFRLNPFWLATGEGSPFLFTTSDALLKLIGNIDGHERFSSAFDKLLEDWPERETSFHAYKVGHEELLAHLDSSRALSDISEEILDRARAAKNHVLRYNEFFASLLPVTAAPGAFWEKLRQRLIRATKARGGKAALADLLHVSRNAVTEWLLGKSAPTADNTLRLLQWVSAEEAESQTKKRAGSGETQPALKTRKRKPKSNEKSKSSPP